MPKIKQGKYVYEFTTTRKRVAENLGVVRNPAQTVEIFRHITSREGETMLIAFLDTRQNILGYEELYRGNVWGISVRVAELFRSAVRFGASNIIIVHNHPTNQSHASDKDIKLTKAAIEAAKILDIDVLDHLILSDTGFTSMRNTTDLWKEETTNA